MTIPPGVNDDVIDDDDDDDDGATEVQTSIVSSQYFTAIITKSKILIPVVGCNGSIGFDVGFVSFGFRAFGFGVFEARVPRSLLLVRLL